METIMFLAEELVIRILLNLVVKDLVRCKCVCKSWYSLITSPSFIDEHLKVSNGKDPHLLVDYRTYNRGDVKPNPSTINLFPPSIVVVSHETLEEVDRQIMLSNTRLVNKNLIKIESCILNCCNGIVCILCDFFREDLVLWNPATRDAKLVRPPPLNRSHYHHGKKSIYENSKMGFGFDARNNDYKVVAIKIMKKIYCQEYYNLPLYKVEVYSLKTNSWRLLPDDIVPIRSTAFLNNFYGGVCTGGMFSWLLGKKVIVSFDMNNDKFILTPFPCASGDKYMMDNTIMVYKESIAIVHVDHIGIEPLKYEIWVLGEYGVEESWTKLFSFRSLERVVVNREVIFGIWNNNSEMYLQASVKELKLYQSPTLWPTTLTSKTLYHYGHRVFIFKVISFKESLVPINRAAL